MNAVAVAQSRLAFSEGDAMLRVAGTYPTIFDMVLEQVQNAIDSNATRIGIILNAKTRNISVFDNGDGVSQDRFEAALSRVCASQKEAGKLGRFGIGLISPLGKCTEFTFMSCPSGERQNYKRWTFNTDAIRSQQRNLSIPMERLPNYVFNPNANAKAKVRGLTEVPWRTRVVVQNYTDDKYISRIDSVDALVQGVLERFGTAMRKKKIRLSVKYVDERGVTSSRENVTATEFSGRPLEEVSIESADAGTVLFRMFMARKTTKGLNGRIVVGELDNDFRFPFSSFARSAGKLLSNECREALQSGALEGEILSSYVELDPTRQSFIKNAAYLGLCIAIEQWFTDHGKAHMRAVKEASEDERYQDLGLRSLRVVEDLLRLPQFKELRDVVHTFKRGSVGEGHHLPTPDQIAGIQKEPSITTAADTATPRSDTEGGNGGERTSPEAENPTHEPFTVAGPRGKRRTLVKKNSLGLQFSHTVMEGSNKLYELDIREGILHFNIRHPLWVECEDNDRRVMQLQEMIAIQALLQQTMPADWQDITKAAFDEQLPPMVHLLMHSNAFNMRPVRTAT